MEQNDLAKPQLHKMFTEPLQQFDLIRHQPLVKKPIAIVIVLSLMSTWLNAFNMYDFNFSDPVLLTSILISSILGIPFGLLIASSIQLGLSTFAKDSTVTMHQLYSMNTHLAMIAILGLFVNGIIALLFNIDLEEQLTSLAFYTHTGTIANYFLGSIEIFFLWNLILVGFGLQRMADFPKTLAWITAAVLFLV